jgi:hypothetical protein
MAPTLELNAAQSLIYSRSNIRRAFNDFDETNIAGIYRRSDHVLIVRNDGTEQSYPIQPIQEQFQSFTGRLKNFFSYLGPNFRGPSLWRHNAYVMFKGWSYVHACGPYTTSAQLQARWADRFIHLPTVPQLNAALNFNEFELGHIVAPNGLKLPKASVDLDSDFSAQQEVEAENESRPWCSCGSFQRQLNNLSDFQAEITGYQPTCIHLTWFQKYRELLTKRAELRTAMPTPDKCVAWWYAPPEDATSQGRFTLLHTTSGAQSPLTHWRTYKPGKHFTADDVWDLFFNMMEAGYVPFPGQSLPQLANAIRKSKANA